MRQFADATLDFLREKVPRRWADLRDSVTDNFASYHPRIFGLSRERVYQSFFARSRQTEEAQPSNLMSTHIVTTATPPAARSFPPARA